MPELIPVVSSSIAAVGYDAGRRELYVRFRDSRAVYAYQEVPPAVFEQLMAAESKGRFVNIEVKPHYDYETLQQRD